jgi:hypothetical protein
VFNIISYETSDCASTHCPGNGTASRSDRASHSIADATTNRSADNASYNSVLRRMNEHGVIHAIKSVASLLAFFQC